MWQYTFAHNRFRRVVNGRVFEIEPADGKHWSLWYRREKEPHHALRIGYFPTVDEAKAAAQDVIRQLAHTRAVLQE